MVPCIMGFPGGTSDKEPTCQCRRHKRCRFNLGSGRSHGGGPGNQLQYSCLGNPMNTGIWWATVHRVTKSWTHWSDLACTHVTDTIRYFSLWFTSLYMIICRFISFFIMVEYYAIVYMFHILSIYSSANGYLGSFHVFQLALLNCLLKLLWG